MINLMQLEAGARVRLRSGAVGEVIENIGDGIWVQVRLTSAGGDDGDGAVGDEELVHCEEIVSMAD
jgi:hypothetical protein